MNASASLPGDDQLLLAMGHAMAGFVDVVASIQPNQWGAPSPCDGWSVFDVVDHVVMGDRCAVRLLAGTSLEDATADLVGLDRATTNPAEETAQVARATLEAFGGSLDEMVDHPVGPLAARRLLGLRVVDYLGHTWDVARGTKLHIALDPAVVEVGLGIVLAEEAVLRKSEHYATLDDRPPDSQDATDAFLHFIGRRP